ncbi:hypothetical protein EYF80_016514 [Liparis tanakae]|uniref:Uncharacterized protein n=1 Tax=Liparis tanakae TaxID=230148 RepID=A0A4Z2I6I3_9TELE|nr:hypothetical protein EYF80_016514 [Liparis tanakae]
MNSSSKSVNSCAIKAEIKRHASLQSAINRLSKQLERVTDQQLRSGLKVYLHSIQVSFWTRAANGSSPQQPSTWQQDETCCAAYFLSASLQPPSKPLPIRRAGPSHAIDNRSITSQEISFAHMYGAMKRSRTEKHHFDTETLREK